MYKKLSVLVAILLGSTLALTACRGPLILSGFMDTENIAGGIRPGPHSGIDFGGQYGAPVLAAAPGKIFMTAERNEGCGNQIVMDHKPFPYYTVYCHMSKITLSDAAKRGEEVKRGEIIGRIGISGETTGTPHVHLEVCRGSCYGSRKARPWHEDPMKFMDGCFDPKKTYPADKWVITAPVQC
jgi:murein DD-endopeptidase MepM/ murein hydrolase activator NlpD